MPVQVTVNNPLTASQAELVAKLGSMKSLLSLPKVKFNNVPKDKQISLFEYLLRVLELMGITPRFLFEVFISKVFDEVFITKQILTTFAAMSAKKGKNNAQFTTETGLDKKGKADLEKKNYEFLNSQIGSQVEGFFKALKLKIAKDLATMIFGSSGDLVTDAYMSTPVNYGGTTYDTNLNDLKRQSVCGAQLFSLTNNPSISEADLEYNRIQLLKELDQGGSTYTVSCQGVSVSLPQNPKFMFEGGGPQTVSGPTVFNPEKMINTMITDVGNQVQKANDSKNAGSASDSFATDLVQKIIQYAPALVKPVFNFVFEIMEQVEPASTDQANYYGYTKNSMLSSPCQILADPGNNEDKEMNKNFCNLLLKALLGILLQFLIKQIKKLAAAYFAKKGLEKLKRKQLKITLRFKIFNKAKDKAGKASKAKTMYNTIKPILSTSTTLLGAQVEIS